MRLLHTSDWHLGQTLHNFDRTYEHQCFLDWLLDTIVAQEADALLIAGDVFDNSNPSAASQRQLYRFLQQARARAPQLDIVIIAGNHDSPGRLEAPGPLLEAHGTRVVGHVVRDAEGGIDLERFIVPLTGKDGNVKAWCVAIPFLRPGDVPRVASQVAGDDAFDAYLAGIRLLYQQAYDLARARATGGQAILAMGHCHMVGGDASPDSERRIVIGGTEALPASMFGPDVAYAALGHLHLAQRVGQQEHLRYSGSPLPLSFAEVGYRHQVLRIDLDGPRAAAIEPLHVPRAVELLRVPASPAPVKQAIAELVALDLPDLPRDVWPYLEVRVLLDAPEPGLRAQVEAALEGKPVRLAKIEPTRRVVTTAGVEPALSLDQLAQLQPDDIFRRLWQQRFGEDAPDDQLAAFTELLLPADGSAKNREAA
ncbi:exonuclease SbcCD subunit D C-terminal domain-containing protein [Telluria mixta]|uniref:Nuclease SbcCD subunit D n=1 Tax=Telluria mixta TaxID=34071 RepID=A0ABT2BT48_9BURK|nr:exonuclease SbcCD subunit D C-terminal domain-containing protein [Telluria mixta]MCS0628293.1 exonuclease SbcCD subunit D C-terminal domain-containing protein [Telluria mixta]WEM93596.1 exonuclease SbcCD subunit D C-terminal domain-containing protein [Telluria mixta]